MIGKDIYLKKYENRDKRDKHLFKHNDHFYILETMPAFPNCNSSRASH